MAHVLIMPRQGNTVESCILINWKVKEGDSVNEETPICEIETDKASFEIPAGVSGSILKILCDEGDDIPVLKPIAVIGSKEEDWQSALEKNIKEQITQKKEAPERENKPEISGLDNPSAGETGNTGNIEKTGRIFASPRARNLAKNEFLNLEDIPGTGPDGRITESDVKKVLSNRPALSVAAKAQMPTGIPKEGSGLGGRIILSDMALAENPATPLPLGKGAINNPALNGRTLLCSGVLNPSQTIKETVIKGIRKIISDRMIKSLSESAQFTLNSSAPASTLLDIHSRLKTSTYTQENPALCGITINDLILFAVSRTLPDFPYMNAHFDGSSIKTYERIHLGFAVDTPRGLMVPVIQNSNLLSLSQISSESKRLASSCKNYSIRANELSGSTFTVTNLGSLGISSFTPVLNIPEVAILGVCSIEMKLPAYSAEKCNCPFGTKAEPHIGFSLTINHQVVDGAPAARFLKALCEAIANIDLLLALV